MARYTVAWDAELEAAYLEAWLAGDSKMRASLTEVANWLDKELTHDPELKGQAISEIPSRAVDVVLSTSTARVSAVFEVSADDRMVRVRRILFRGP